jgi:hypothetical protein
MRTRASGQLEHPGAGVRVVVVVPAEILARVIAQRHRRTLVALNELVCR